MTCIFEDTFLFSSRFLSLSLHFLTSLEIPIHLFGVWLIYTKTPKTMNSAKSSIMQLHIACSIMDFYLSFLLVFYIWMPSPAGVPVGFMTMIGVSSVIQLFMGCIILTTVALTIVASFENRYDALVIGQIGRSSTRNFKRIAYFSLNGILSLFYILYVFWVFPNAEQARKKTLERQPCIPKDLENHRMYVNMNTDNPNIPIMTFTMIILINLQGSYFFFYTIYYLFFSVRNVSKATQSIQRKFFVAMTLQAFIPMAAFVGPLFYCYLVFMYNYYNQMYNNFAMIFICVHGLLTTIVMILAHSPYRNFVCGVLGKGRDVMGSSRVFTRNQTRVVPQRRGESGAYQDQLPREAHPHESDPCIHTYETVEGQFVMVYMVCQVIPMALKKEDYETTSGRVEWLE